MTETPHVRSENEVWQKQHEIIPVPNERIRHEVLHYAALCLPEFVHWCGGTEQERHGLKYHAASDAEDVPPHTIIGTAVGSVAHHDLQSDRLPGADAGASLRQLFHNSMKGRTMYVVPFLMPQEGTDPQIVGIQLTDSAEVASEIENAFPSGDCVWASLAKGTPFWLCLHAVGGRAFDENRVRWELPTETTLWAYGRDYGVHTLRRVLRGA